MMRSPSLLEVLGLVSAIGAAPLAPAGADEQSRERLIEEALTLSGARAQIAQIESQAQSGLQEHQERLGPEMHSAIRRLVTEQVRAEVVTSAVTRRIHEDFDAARMAGALAWLRSPLSKKITRLETQASRPEAALQIERFVARLRSQRPAARRLELIRRLDDAARATESSLDLVIAVVRSLAAAIDPALPPEKRLRPGELESLERRMRSEGRGQIQQAVAFRMLFTYQSLPDAELARYAEFWESDAGRWFGDTLGRALIHSIGVAMREVGEEIARRLPAGAPATSGPR